MKLPKLLTVLKVKRLKKTKRHKYYLIYSIIKSIPLRTLFVLSCCVFIHNACSTTIESVRESQSTKPTSSTLRNDIVAFAKQQIGDKYKYGAKGPNQFDCSGLVAYVFKSEGISVRGSADNISKQGRSIEVEDAKPGDLVFFRKGGKIFHVSIISDVYHDQIWVVHSTTSRGVIEEDLISSSYWKPKMYKIISLEAFK